MKRHPIDPISAVAGVLFSAFGIILLSGEIDLTGDGFRWVWPTGLIALGLAVLATIRPQPIAEAPSPEDSTVMEEQSGEGVD